MMEKAKINPTSASSPGKAAANQVAAQQADLSNMRMPEQHDLPERPREQLSADSPEAMSNRNNLPPFAPSIKTGNLPDEIQAKMERSFGEDFSDVEVLRNSDVAKNMDAVALTQGNAIHFAPGYDPFSSNDEAILGHELAHVVQQRHGRVAPTHYEGGVGVNDAKELEAEADDYGRMASRGERINSDKGSPVMRSAIQKKSSVVQMWRPLPGQARAESTQPDIEGAWRAVASAIRQVAGGFGGGIINELRPVIISRISEELAGNLGTIIIDNIKSYSGPNMTWRGDIQFRIDGVQELGGGGVGTTVLGAGGSTTTGGSMMNTQTGGVTGSGTVSSSPGSSGGTGGSATLGVSSGSTNAQGSSASHVSNSTSSSSVSQVLKRYRASIGCFVNMSAESSFGDSGWDYVNPFAWPSGAAVSFVDAIGETTGSASSNCGTIVFYEGSGIATP